MRKQILMAMATLMMIGSTVPSYAAVIEAGAGKTQSQKESTAQETTESTTQEETKSEETQSSDGISWIIPKDTLSATLRAEYGTDQWWVAEAIAQCNKWAEDNKGDIPSISDEKERYQAIVNKVTGFLTYDVRYIEPHIAYTIRDGKGVCADYTALTKHLCDVCGIQSEVSIGSVEGAGHDMLKVTLDGHVYYSDPVSYASDYAPLYVEGIPSYYTEDTILPDAGEGYTGADTDADWSVLSMEASNRGEAIIAKGSDGVWYGSTEDAIALDKAIENWDMETVNAIYDKYGVPHA